MQVLSCWLQGIQVRAAIYAFLFVSGGRASVMHTRHRLSPHAAGTLQTLTGSLCQAASYIPAHTLHLFCRATSFK